MQIIETTFCLLLSFLLYEILLRKETFFQLNRLYLLLMPLVAFVVPFLQWAVKEDEIIPVISPFIETSLKTQTIVYQSVREDLPLFSLSIGEMLFGVYLFVFFIKITKLSMTLWQMSLLIKKSKKEQQNSFTLLKSEMPVSSFFSYIFWNDDEKSENQYFMLQHELVHVKQWHSADVLLMELMVALQWFNPLVYYFKNRLKEVHEFIADEYVVQKTGQSYQYVAVLVTMAQRTALPPSVVNTFSSFTKQRLIMLTNSRSSFWKAAKYLLALPLLCTFVLLFSFDLIAKIPTPLPIIEATLNNITEKTITVDKNFNLQNNNDLQNNIDKKAIEKIIIANADTGGQNGEERFIFYWGSFQLNFEYNKNQKAQTVKSAASMTYDQLQRLIFFTEIPHFWNGKSMDEDFSFRVSYIDSSTMEMKNMVVNRKELLEEKGTHRSDHILTFFKNMKPKNRFVIDQIQTPSTGECKLIGSVLVTDEITRGDIVRKITKEDIDQIEKNNDFISDFFDNKKQGKIDFKWGSINPSSKKITKEELLNALLYQPTMFNPEGQPIGKTKFNFVISFPQKKQAVELYIQSDVSDASIYKKLMPVIYQTAAKAEVGNNVYIDNISGESQDGTKYQFSLVLEIVE